MDASVCCGTAMPKFYEAVSPTDEVVSEPSMDSKPRRSISFFLIYVLAFFYFAFSCGMESFFQSQSFTFGLCGPHKLQPQDAAVLTTVYFATFPFGRSWGIIQPWFSLLIVCIQVFWCVPIQSYDAKDDDYHQPQ